MGAKKASPSVRGDPKNPFIEVTLIRRHSVNILCRLSVR